MFADPHEFLSASAAAHLVGRPVGAIQRAGRRGEIRTSQERGSPPRYHRRDVLAWAGILPAD